jgi:hypothetical protein
VLGVLEAPRAFVGLALRKKARTASERKEIVLETRRAADMQRPPRCILTGTVLYSVGGSTFFVK